MPGTMMMVGLSLPPERLLLDPPFQGSPSRCISMTSLSSVMMRQQGPAWIYFTQLKRTVQYLAANPGPSLKLGDHDGDAVVFASGPVLLLTLLSTA